MISNDGTLPFMKKNSTSHIKGLIDIGYASDAIDSSHMFFRAATAGHLKKLRNLTIALASMFAAMLASAVASVVLPDMHLLALVSFFLLVATVVLLVLTARKASQGKDGRQSELFVYESGPERLWFYFCESDDTIQEADARSLAELRKKLDGPGKKYENWQLTLAVLAVSAIKNVSPDFGEELSAPCPDDEAPLDLIEEIDDMYVNDDGSLVSFTYLDRLSGDRREAVLHTDEWPEFVSWLDSQAAGEQKRR